MDLAVREAKFASLIILMMNNQATCEYIIRERQTVLKDVINVILCSANNLMNSKVRKYPSVRTNVV